MDSGQFYDDYVERQVAAGVNARHRSILDWLLRSGLSPGDRVLEIGAGIGTLTGLIAAELGGSRLVAVDLSPRSIETARSRLARVEGLELLAGDALELEVDGPFDVVVLPDVVEHIPMESHGRLFERLAGWVAPDGFVLIHYPDPFYLRWIREHRPELLQQVDQSVPVASLVRHADAAGLHLHHLARNPVWVEEGDYVVAVFRPPPRELRFTDREQPKGSVLERLARRLGRGGRGG